MGSLIWLAFVTVPGAAQSAPSAAFTHRPVNALSAERTLDFLFASGDGTPEIIAISTDGIGGLEARLRSVHLRAHLAMMDVLTASQIARSWGLRSYEHRHDDTGAGQPEFMLVVHGGAGTIRRADLTPAAESAYRQSLTEAIRAGYEVLRAGGRALDAVVAVVTRLEDDTLFNAGRGAVFTNAGTNELDAAIMDGRTGNAGAVAGVTNIKNPILLARRVMERSAHVMLAREGAEAFALEQGMDTVPASYFRTKRRLEQLRRARDGGEHGTVGAVALDVHGDLAAATSTGGMTNKRWGRIGDSPLIGAGTWASNENCAVSATGHGEFFIRQAVAHDVCARVEYLGESPAEAARHVIHVELPTLGATGGVIVVDRRGRFAAPFNTPGMYRGWVGSDGAVVVRIYADEDTES